MFEINSQTFSHLNFDFSEKVKLEKTFLFAHWRVSIYEDRDAQSSQPRLMTFIAMAHPHGLMPERITAKRQFNHGFCFNVVPLRRSFSTKKETNGKGGTRRVIRGRTELILLA